MIRSVFSALGLLIRVILALVLIAELVLGCLRSVQRLSTYGASRREWHDLLAIHARADRRHSRAAGEVPADAFHRLRNCGAFISGSVYLRRLVPG